MSLETLRALLATLPPCDAPGCPWPSTGYRGRWPPDAGAYLRRGCPAHSDWTPAEGPERARARAVSEAIVACQETNRPVV